MSRLWLRYGAYAVIGEVALTVFFLHGTGFGPPEAVLLATVTVFATAFLAALLTRHVLLALRIAIAAALLWILPMLYDLVTNGGVYGWSDLAIPGTVLLVLAAFDVFSRERSSRP